MDKKALEDGISFGRKRKRKEDEPESDEKVSIEPESPQSDIQDLLLQERLGQKLKTAKTINYSGFAVNGGTILFVLYGVYEFALDPNTAQTITLFNETFGTNFDYDRFVELVEKWKTHIISMSGSIQVGFMWYQSMRSKMFEQRSPKSFLKFINDELDGII